MEKLSFTAIYKLLSSELFNKKQVNKEIRKWLIVCFEQPFSESNASDLNSFIRGFDDPASGNDSANFFNKRLDSSNTDFRIHLADYLMENDGASLNNGNMKLIRNCISDQLAKKIEESRRIGELYSKSDPDDTVVHDIVEKLLSYDLASAESLKGRIQDMNRTDPYSAFMLLTIVSLFGDKCRAELPDTKSASTLFAAQKFDRIVELLSEEERSAAELIRSSILTSFYNGDEFLFNEEWRHFLNTGGERTGRLADISLETLLQYAVELNEEKRDHFNVKNNNDQSIQICIASINAAAGHRSDISVCLYLMQLYTALVHGYWRKKDNKNYSRYFYEAKEYRRQVLSIISSLNPCFDMSEEAEQKRRILEKQMKNGIPATVTFLHREAIHYSYTHQTEKSIDTYYNYISALNNYSGDHIDYVRWLTASAENDLAFVMMKAFDLSNAEKYFDLSLYHRQQLLEDRERRSATACSNLAQINKIINEFDKALEYAEKASVIREKLLNDGTLGPGTLMLSENTYTDIYIRMALRESGTERARLLAKAKERMNKVFQFYEMIESTGSEGAISMSQAAYIKSLILAGVISSIEGEHERALSLLNRAQDINSERYTEGVDEAFNLPYIKRSILIRILLAEVDLRSGKTDDAGAVLVPLREELSGYLAGQDPNAERRHFYPILQWCLCNVLYTQYLIEEGADSKEIQEYVKEARTAADSLCSTDYTLNDRYRDNNRKAYGKLSEYADHVLPFIEKGKAPETEFHSICFLMML